MSRDLGRDVPDLEQLYARKLWADFSYPPSKWRGRFGRQTAGGPPKASPRPRQPLFAAPALRELERACRVSIL